MTIIDFLTRKVTSPAWAYTSKGVIWRLLLSESGVFVGEDRDIESKKTTFFCIDQRSGRVLWKGKSFHEQWWIGIEAAHGDHVLLHGFMKPDMPQHKGVTAVELGSGEVAWSEADFSFILAAEGSVFAAKDSPGGVSLFELDCRTGETLHAWGDNNGALLAARKRLLAREANEPDFPVPSEILGVMDERIAAFVSRHSEMQNIVGQIEGIESNGFFFYSYHETDGRENRETNLRNILKGVDLKTGRIVLTETLNTNVGAVVPDSFFIHHDMLYFIKDRSTLTAVNIRELQ